MTTFQPRKPALQYADDWFTSTAGTSYGSANGGTAYVRSTDQRQWRTPVKSWVLERVKDWKPLNGELRHHDRKSQHGPWEETTFLGATMVRRPTFISDSS